MSQKVQKYRNTNEQSKTFGKYYVRPVYDKKFITTSDLADFIQTQCTVKRSDVKAVLDELGGAFKHYFELGQKIKLDNIGIFKVGISSGCSDTEDGCTASLVKSLRVNFQPETTAVLKGTKQVTRAKMVNGVATSFASQVQIFSHPATMLKDVSVELTHDVNGSGIGSGSGGSSDGGDGGSGGDGGDEPRP